jgi:hypothetical protein
LYIRILRDWQRFITIDTVKFRLDLPEL